MERQKSRLTKPSSLELMRRLPCLRPLSDLQVKKIHDSTSLRNVGAGGVIFRESGKSSRDTYLLLTGTAQMNCFSERGSSTVAVLPAGLLFKSPHLPDEIYGSVEAVALRRCSVASLPTERFASIASGVSPTDHAKIGEAWEIRLSTALLRYSNFVNMTVSQRMAMTLLELAHDFAVQESRGTLLQISFTHQQLAELAGASRSRVTRALHDFEDAEVIWREGRRLILNVRRLREILSLCHARN